MVNMLSKLSSWFHAWAKGWLILAIFAAFVVFLAVTLPVGIEKQEAASGNAVGFDTHFFYTPEQAYSMVAAFGDSGRTLYRNGLLTIDLVIPVLYTLFLGLLMSWLFQRGFKPESKMQKMNVLPVGMGAFDLLENICVVTMLSVYPAQFVAVAWLSTVCTMTKLSLAGLIILLVLVGLVKAAIMRFRKP
jgi:hypothetical protein